MTKKKRKRTGIEEGRADGDAVAARRPGFDKREVQVMTYGHREKEQFSALANETRIEIVSFVGRRAEGAGVAEIIKAVGCSQPNASHHLGILAKSGVLDRARKGREVIYTINRDTVGALALCLADVFDAAGRQQQKSAKKGSKRAARPAPATPPPMEGAKA